MKQFESTRVAVVQAAPIVFDREKTLEKVRDLSADAAKTGAKIVLFPEAFVSAYPKGSTFGSVVGTRSMDGRIEYQQYWESAVDVPGPAVDFLGNVARENQIYLVIGVIERDGGTLYCCVLFFAPDGTYLGKHRKLMPTGCERLVWGFGDGSTMPVYDTPFGKLGSVICWENYMPLMRAAMYAKGINIWCAPTADPRDTWIASMQHIAIEGRTFVLSCNQYTTRADFPADFPCELGDAPDTVISRGGSCIINPFGEIIAGPNFEGEAIITADIDANEVLRGKFDFDAVGHYSRPDVFQLRVNESPQTAVTSYGAIKLEADEAV
ncbi:MAG TPA: nitrilase-related carbon-nitrogen hydrolase [Eoetvoesiella sp.]